MRRGRFGRLTKLAAAVGLAAGCVTIGEEFPVAPVAELEIGQTTRAQVRQAFGDPWRVGVEDGDLTWTYARYRYSAFGPEQTRDLVVRFDASGRVRSYTFNSTDAADADRARP